jgi:AmiR/NasT family two-component response regulator
MKKRPASPLRVLIVEDEALLVMDIESVVQDAGHQVLSDVASVYDLESLELEMAPDLVLIDVNLARGTSGLDASMIVRERWVDSFIVFVTANPGKIPEGHAGAHGVIAKPFSEKGLTSALEYICQGICAPPPKTPLPGSFISFPAFEASWAL